MLRICQYLASTVQYFNQSFIIVTLASDLAYRCVQLNAALLSTA